MQFDKIFYFYNFLYIYNCFAFCESIILKRTQIFFEKIQNTVCNEALKNWWANFVNKEWLIIFWCKI
jgi:hypothetical protein